MNCFFGHHRSGSTYVKTILKTFCIHQGLTNNTIHKEDDLDGLTNPNLLLVTNASLGILKKINYYRKGIPGDWVNYFTEDHKRIFKEQWGDLLIHLGYEKDKNW